MSIRVRGQPLLVVAGLSLASACSFLIDVSPRCANDSDCRSTDRCAGNRCVPGDGAGGSEDGGDGGGGGQAGTDAGGGSDGGCAPGFRECDGGCLASTSCCSKDDCPPATTDTCLGGVCQCGADAACTGVHLCQTSACSCPTGTQPCGTACLATPSCCTGADCSGGQICNAAKDCVCPAGQTWCGGSCVTIGALAGINATCACGEQCMTGTCCGGRCRRDIGSSCGGYADGHYCCSNNCQLPGPINGGNGDCIP